MRETKPLCLLSFFVVLPLFFGCTLDSEGAAAFPPGTGDAGPDQNNPDTSPWFEASAPDTDAEPDVSVDAPKDVADEPDAPKDVISEPDAAEDVIEADAPEDVVDEDSPIDSPEDVVEADAPVDAPEDVIEADAPEPVLCFGVPTETDHVMICAELPGGTAKSIIIKAQIVSNLPGHAVPFKSVCWSEVGVAELACFPCPDAGICWPIPDGGLPRAQVASGDKVKFQPGIADGPGKDMNNTLCDLGECYQGRYKVYSGHTEVCRIEPDGSISGGTYEGSGTDVKIVCTL